MNARGDGLGRILYLLARGIAFFDGRGYGTATIQKEVRSVRRFVSGGIFCDVGANKGAYTRELLKQFGKSASRIFCFEPSDELVKAHLVFDDARVSVIHAALGHASGTGSLSAPDQHSGLGSLTRRRLDHFGLEAREVQDVKILTLDDFVANNAVDHIALLKIDVEGHELDVLQGSSKLLEEKRIRCIQFEFGGCNIDTRTYFQDFWYLLAVKYQFDIFRITPLGLIHLTKYREIDETFLTTNYIAVKRN